MTLATTEHGYKLLSAIIARRLHLELADIFPDSQAYSNAC